MTASYQKQDKHTAPRRDGSQRRQAGTRSESGIGAMRLGELQPSQLFISSEKLAQILRGLDSEGMGSLEPLPIKELDGRVILTDGHTRALAAFLRGLDEVPVYWDEDELDWEAYRICVAWCQEAGVHTVVDLAGRILCAEDYELLWRGRCRQMQKELASWRQGRQDSGERDARRSGVKAQANGIDQASN